MAYIEQYPTDSDDYGYGNEYDPGEDWVDCGCYQERDTGAWIACPFHENQDEEEPAECYWCHRVAIPDTYIWDSKTNSNRPICAKCELGEETVYPKDVE